MRNIGAKEVKRITEQILYILITIILFENYLFQTEKEFYLRAWTHPVVK